MTRREWILGLTTTVLALMAGTVSFDYVNRRFPDKAAQTNTQPSGACVDAGGAWKNWSYPNVPMLSPKCE